MSRLLLRRHCQHDDEGAIFTEYAFVLLAVAMVALIAAQLVGTRVLTLLTSVITAI
jgi:Flp pilus assembly pilin Flp